MGIEAFGMSHRGDYGGEEVESFRGEFLIGDLMHEAINIHSAERMRPSRCGEGMICARSIIARALRREISDKYASGSINPGGHIPRIAH